MGRGGGDFSFGPIGGPLSKGRVFLKGDFSKAIQHLIDLHKSLILSMKISKLNPKKF